MNDERMRRISDALDAPGGLDADDELRAMLADDPTALAYAQDLVRIDEVLRSFGAARAEPDWEALAARIEARLDDELDVLPGIDAAPDLDDGAPPRREPAVSQEVPITTRARDFAVMAPSASRGPAPVADLAARRSRTPFYWMGGLAAAAAIGLGITFGMTSLEGDDMLASAPTMQSAERAPALAMSPEPTAAPADMAAPAEPSPEASQSRGGSPGGWGHATEAEAPAELPAVAVVQPSLARGDVGAGGGGMAEPRAERRLAATPAPPQAPRPSPTTGRAPPNPADFAGTPRPSRVAVLAALESAEPAVQRCLAARGQVARLNVQVGADGSVVSVRVDPPYAGSEARCIVQAVRAIRLPPSVEDYTVMHSFQPAPMAAGSLARPPNAARARGSARSAEPATLSEAFRH